MIGPSLWLECASLCRLYKGSPRECHMLSPSPFGSLPHAGIQGECSSCEFLHRSGNLPASREGRPQAKKGSSIHLHFYTFINKYYCVFLSTVWLSENAKIKRYIAYSNWPWWVNNSMGWKDPYGNNYDYGK